MGQLLQSEGTTNRSSKRDRQSQVEASRRAAAIFRRLRLLTGLLALLVVTHIVLDLILFPFGIAAGLTVLRVATAVVMTAVAFSSRRHSPVLNAHWASISLYSVPVFQCAISYAALGAYTIGTAAAISAAELYLILPLATLATVTMLPLTLGEILLVATPALIAAAAGALCELDSLINSPLPIGLLLLTSSVSITAGLGNDLLARLSWTRLRARAVVRRHAHEANEQALDRHTAVARVLRRQ